MDLSIIILYVVITASVALIYKVKYTSFARYSTPEIKFDNKFLVMATVFSTAVGGGTVLGLPEKVYAANASIVYALLITILVDIYLARILVNGLSKYKGSITIGDVIHQHYGNLGKVICGIFAVLVSFGYVAVQVSVIGKIFSYFFNISYFYSVCFSYGVIILYSTIGGINSIVRVSLLQFIAIIIGIPLICIIGVNDIGVKEFIFSVPNYKYSFLNADVSRETFFMLLNFSVVGIYPAFLQRVLFAENPKAMMDGIILKCIVYSILVCIIGINGLIAYAKFAGAEDSSPILHLIDILLPAGIKGLVLVGFLAAANSTADADLNIASTSLVNDVLKPLLTIENQRHLKYIAQFINVVLGLLSLAIALKFDVIVDLVLFVGGMWAPAMFIPIIALALKCPIDSRQLLACVISGMLGFAVWEYYFCGHTLRGVFVGVITNFAMYLLCYMHNKFKNRAII